MTFPSTRWRVTGFLALAVGLNYADRSAISAVFGALRTDLGISDVALGLIGSVFLWSYALSSLYAGNLADRYSRSKIVMWSLLLWSAVTFFTGAATGLYTLLALRVCLGVAESLYLPSGIALLADHHDSATRGFAMGLHSVGLSLGVVAGGAASGYLADRYGWRSGFWLLGAIGIGCALCSPWFLTDGPAAKATDLPRPTYREALRYLARVPSYYVLLAKAMLAGVGVWIFFNWLPLYFGETFHMSLGAAGLAGTFMIQVSGIAGMAVGGWLSDRVARRDPRRRMLFQALSYFGAAPFLLLFIYTPTFGAVAFAISAFSFLRNLGASNENPALCEIVPAQLRSTSIGIMNTCATGAGGVGVALAGFLKSYWGLKGSFAATSVLFVLAGAILTAGYFFFMTRDIERAQQYEADRALA